MKTRKQTEISATAIYRIAPKDGSKPFYAVASDSQSGVYYSVTCVGFDRAAKQHKLHCDCPATVECKHIRAVRVVLGHKAAEKAATALVAETVSVETVDAPMTEEQKQAVKAHIAEITRNEYEVLAATKTTSSERASAVTCDYCGRNHRSSTCFL